MPLEKLLLTPNFGTHMFALLRVLDRTTGPVVELGVGLYSTPMLHYICQMHGRHLTSYEDNPRFFDWMRWYQADHHDVLAVDNWDAIDLSHPWSVALVDHNQKRGRYKELARLTHAKYVVAHDSEDSHDRAHRYSTVEHLYKYKRRDESAYPQTTVFSNFHPLGDLW